ncbi:MAG: rhomboid family intramembrane serine protease [Deltaproteobacteria bacterium]|nr:rhomboid family intramembrane serine protease [Deltaproteobacteria bacterium]
MTGGQRQSMLCPNCGKLISISETRCPHCGIGRPASMGRRLVKTIGLSDPARLIRAVIYVNAAMYLIALVFSQSRIGLSMNPLTFLAPGDNSLFLLGMTGTIPIDRFGRWWSLLAANYLHGGILHIFFNMAAFRQLAALVATEYGTARMTVIYTASGILGFLVSYLAGVSFTIGASAAVCGLIGALLYFGKSRGGLYGHIIYRQVGAWAIGLAVFGLLIPGINNWGHIGGGVAGALVGYLLGYRDRAAERPIHRLLAALCTVTTLAVLLYAVVSAFIYRLAV